ncbi:CDP-glycerol glycerophosphotransferase family protein [Brucepastera parasyntrophica]|uniref:CDP-glycerol glycerophosphotransferase family protein n=1 Tax=Brucepastera parasyntrophica TaxID=2880008 RepID=UPI0021098DDC|nr:CDP-glycerol glycerophosphotransferase family protein [Brucepastera parasyntrophica]ULQ60043.1 CDP-glycerol glycerophosphotransferase family protein [Brucepastera parasyntrophica]
MHKKVSFIRKFLINPIIDCIKYYSLVVPYYLFRIVPIKKYKIFISNYSGKGYSDNAKYIVENILKQKLDFDLVWSVIPGFNDSIPPQIRQVKYGSLRAKYEEATAKIWIDNSRKLTFVRKRKKQFYIQTWHGSVALKKIEKDAEDKLPCAYIEKAKHDSQLINLILSNSGFCTEMYKRAFWYDGEILESGSPRNDILIKKPEDKKKKVYDYFHLDYNTKILLYAPTFRTDYNTDTYNIHFSEALSALSEKNNCKVVFLVRLHPNISERSENLFFSDTVINATFYPDMQELMLVSDILITDYSSSMFEFILMKKPVFLYINDYHEYMEERGFYFDLTSLPFPLAVNTDDLIQKIIYFDSEKYVSQLNAFFQQLQLFEDGNASDRVVNRIIRETAE